MTTAPKSQAPIKSYPSPAPLATQTDLRPDEVLAITTVLNALIADAFTLYTKTKNYHWHVAGSHFQDYHKLLDKQAESILESIDPLAERVRSIGGTTIRSISHISQMQTIQDDNSDYVPAGEMARRLMEDNKSLAQMQRAAHAVCTQNHDMATASVLEGIINDTELRTWYLFEVCINP